MPRGEHEFTEYPFRRWVLEVDDYNRIRPDHEVSTLVSWLDLAQERIECVGTPGSVGGVQLRPLRDHEEEVRRFREALGGTLPAAVESGRNWLDAARLLATAWRMPISVEKTRISLTLPEPPRREGLLPQAGGRVVLFGFGEILEIWDAVHWRDHVRALAKHREAAISETIENLEQR